jgi:type VI secretion system protein ImpC
MPPRESPVRVQLAVDPDAVPVLARPQADAPFCILVAGDFSGRGLRSKGGAAVDLTSRRPIHVDRDDLDQVMEQLAPGVEIPLDQEGLLSPIRFRAMDDFLPDRLYERLPVFRALRDLRWRAFQPGGLEPVIKELRGEAPPPGGGPASAERLLSGGSLLDQVVSGAEAEEGAEPGVQDELRTFVRKVVAPHLLPKSDPKQAELLARVDAVISEQLRVILHHARFQAVEALWRSVFLMTRQLETGTDLRLYLLDLSRAELDDAVAGDDPGRSALYRLLANHPPAGDGQWTIIAGEYDFGPEPTDIQVLHAAAGVAASLGAVWLSAARPQMVGCAEGFHAAPDPVTWARDPAPAWHAFRQTRRARSVGLVAPRFLARLPYGEEGEPCERLKFEELEEPASHQAFLWGNGAAIAALLLGQSFAAAGWDMRPGTHAQVDGLPFYLLRDAGESTMQPCAEALLTERALARIAEHGVMPLASIRDEAAVRLAWFQSAASPAAPLAGRWTGT